MTYKFFFFFVNIYKVLASTNYFYFLNSNDALTLLWLHNYSRHLAWLLTTMDGLVIGQDGRQTNSFTVMFGDLDLYSEKQMPNIS